MPPDKINEAPNSVHAPGVSVSTMLPNELPQLPRCVAFVVINPDAMAQDLWNPLVERLAMLRLDVLAATSLVMTPPLQAKLYARGTFKEPRPAGTATNWLSYGAAELDSSIAAIVRTPFDIDLTGLLDRWKGASRFGRREPGDLRSIAPAAHRCYSVLHTPDDSTQAAEDISQLFGPTVLRQVSRFDAPRRCAIGELHRLRMPFRLASAPHPYDIILRSAIRACAVLAYDHITAPAPGWTQALELLVEVRAELEVAGSAVGIQWREASARLAVKLPPEPSIEAWAPRSSAAMRVALHGALLDLLSPMSYDAVTCRGIEAAFRANDLFLDPWELHTLRIAMVFPLD